MHNPLNRLVARWRRARGQRCASFAEVERAEQIFYLEYLREGMTVFDAGANVGELTLLFSRFVGATGHVHAFEASRECFTRLTTICQAAGRRNVHLNHTALAAESGSVLLYVYPDEYLSFNSQIRRPLENYGFDVAPVGTEEVTATTIDLYCERHAIGQIDLLKVDVEGAELQVLQGARRMLAARRIRRLTFEFGQTTFEMGNRPAELAAELENAGYRIRNLVPGDPVFPGRESVTEARYAMHIAQPVE